MREGAVRRRPTREEVLEAIEGSYTVAALYAHSNIGSVSAKVTIKDGKAVTTFDSQRYYTGDGSVGFETLDEAVNYMLDGRRTARHGRG